MSTGLVLDCCSSVNTPSIARPVSLCNACFDSDPLHDLESAVTGKEHGALFVFIAVLLLLDSPRSDDTHFDPEQVRFAVICLHDPCSFGDDDGGCLLGPPGIAASVPVDGVFVCGGLHAVDLNLGTYRFAALRPSNSSPFDDVDDGGPWVLGQLAVAESWPFDDGFVCGGLEAVCFKLNPLRFSVLCFLNSPPFDDEDKERL